MSYESQQISKEEMKKINKECNWQDCKKNHVFRDWTGAKFCLSHWWYILNLTESKWFYFKTTRFTN